MRSYRAADVPDQTAHIFVRANTVSVSIQGGSCRREVLVMLGAALNEKPQRR